MTLKQYTWDDISPTVGTLGPFYLASDVDALLLETKQEIERLRGGVEVVFKFEGNYIVPVEPGAASNGSSAHE